MRDDVQLKAVSHDPTPPLARLDALQPRRRDAGRGTEGGVTDLAYAEFLRRKAITAPAAGIDDPGPCHESLFPFQRDVVRWALRRGRAALFEECGLGKSRQAIEWARQVHEHTGQPVLILTPLAVAVQFVREGAAIGVEIHHSRDGALAEGITVTNYEQVEKFDCSRLGGVVLDESSILKAFDGKTRNQLIELFQRTPFRLACTATPAPNDHAELGNHAEFLGLMSRVEMLSTFFVHDGGSTQDWRIKGHARGEFWRWVCSWAASLTRPGDLGYSDDGYLLPELAVHEHVVEASEELGRSKGLLIGYSASTLSEQREARRETLADRVRRCAEIVAAEPGEQWIVWCDLNQEGDAIEAAIPGAVQVTGSDPAEAKERAVVDFTEGRIRVLVSKPSIFGFGVNMQQCSRAAFVGVSHSFEQWHQATRRIWRFGQRRPVDIHVITSDAEGRVVANLRRKQADAERMQREMVAAMSNLNRADLTRAARQSDEYNATMRMGVPAWLRSA